MISLARRILRRIAGLVLNPRLRPERHELPLCRLGTAYGGWVFVETPALRGATIVSCGLGEDASFDVEFARKLGARVILVDPTPRAIAHFQAFSARAGLPAARPWTDDGALPADSYDLRGVAPGAFTLVPKALWREKGTLRFYTPPDPNFVSHSIVNFQNDYREDTGHIEVEATTLDELLREAGLARLALIKLDIEGAEIEVLHDMLGKGILPGQVLVEYDELNVPSRKSRDRVLSAHRALLQHGYRLVNFERPSNATYWRPEAP
jgi:FkbM family methyltransferase